MKVRVKISGIAPKARIPAPAGSTPAMCEYKICVLGRRKAQRTAWGILAVPTTGAGVIWLSEPRSTVEEARKDLVAGFMFDVREGDAATLIISELLNSGAAQMI